MYPEKIKFNYFGTEAGRKLSEWLVVALVITAFFNIGMWVENAASFRSGLFDPFVTPRIQLFDVVFLLLLLILGLRDTKPMALKIYGKKAVWAGLVTVGLALASAVWGLDPTQSAFFFLRGVEVLGIFWVLRGNIISGSRVIDILILMAVLQGILAILQFATQGSLGLGFLGESQLSADLPGVAKLSWGGSKLIRSYGTFAHANILGGVLAGIWTLALMREKISRNDKWALLVIGLALVLTFSRAAILGAALASLWWWWQKTGQAKKKIWLAIIMISAIAGMVFVARAIGGERSIDDRLGGYLRAVEIIGQNPVWGVGPGNYTLALDQEAEITVWERQPAHSVPLVLAAEMGLPVAIMVVIFLIIFLHKRIKWAKIATGAMILAILPSLVFDHYFWSTPQGLVFLILFAYLISELPRERYKVVDAISKLVRKEKKRKPYRKPRGLRKLLSR